MTVIISYKNQPSAVGGGAVFLALRYKREGRVFVSRWVIGIFIDLILPHYGAGVDSTSNK
jgi:hypothetical protein